MKNMDPKKQDTKWVEIWICWRNSDTTFIIGLKIVTNPAILKNKNKTFTKLKPPQTKPPPKFSKCQKVLPLSLPNSA